MSEAIETSMPAAPAAKPRQALLFYALPLLGLLLLLVAAPLVRGMKTLYLRDVLNTHFEMKWAQAEAMRGGYFPLLDPYRAGGQPLAGNLNAAPFYPDNLLFLLGSELADTVFWAFNAHFWIHLLLAPLAFFWMARAWGLREESAWAGAACWTASGFYLSHLSFYNLIAGVTLAPALVAACLRFAQGRRRAMAPAVAVLWTLLILGGDPLMAVLALALAGAALLPFVRDTGRSRDGRPLALLAACFAVGTLIALPQIVEFRRILPVSFRGYRGYTAEAATVASWDPRQMFEWLVPFVFGRPDLLSAGSFWGGRYFTNVPPYYLSLYPGLLTFALIAAAGRPRGRAEWWSLGGIAAGIFLALGRFNPVAGWLISLSGQLRYPVKFWLPVAVGGALLCAVGFERLFFGEEEERQAAGRRFRRTLLFLAAALGGLWVFLTFQSAAANEWARRIIPSNRGDAFVNNERLRWAGLCLLSLAILATLALAARVARRRPVGGGALLIGAHAAAQLLLLRPLYPMDAVVPYQVPPPALRHVPRGEPVVHADFNYLFGPSTLKQGKFPDRNPGAHWMERRAFYELYPFTGPMWRRRYELNVSAEGLDSFLGRMAVGSVKGSKEHDRRLRLLAAWGVGRLLLNHPLEPRPANARLVAELPSFGRTLSIYEVTDRAPAVYLARRVFRAPHLNAAYERLSTAGFDPRSDVVLAGEGPPEPRAGGAVRVLRQGPESLEVETASAGPGVLVVQRSFHLWEAHVDGQPAVVKAANLHRLGVEVPAGRHRVQLFLDRRPLVRSCPVAGIALALLPVLALLGGRRSE